MGSERDESYTVIMRNKPLAIVKADLIHSFLSVSRLDGIRTQAHNGRFLPVTWLDRSEHRRTVAGEDRPYFANDGVDGSDNFTG